MFLAMPDHLRRPLPPLEHGWPSEFRVILGIPNVIEIQVSIHIREGIRGASGVRHHRKHAESTYLDEYLWFKKNLVKKY